MTEWIALLRGVNVNGRTVRSADLAALFADDLGFDGVRTFLASGNVRFETHAATAARAQLKLRIESALSERFGYEAWIVLVTLDELQAAIDGFPFDADDDGRQPYVVFGAEQKPLDDLADAADGMDRNADPVVKGDGVVYWNPRKGTTVDTPFGKLLARAAFASTTTNRNLRTLVKIAA